MSAAKKTPRPIRLPGYTVELSEEGFLGYVHYECRRDSDRQSVAAGGVSRWNYRTARALRSAIKEICAGAVAARWEARS